MSRSTITIGIVFIVIASISLLNLRTSKVQPVVTEPLLDRQPDYSITGINSTLFDKDGNIAYQVMASRMVHYSKEDSTVFSQPYYTFYVEEAEPWILKASKGTLQGKSTLELSDNVEITTTDSKGFVRKIETDHIIIDLTSKEIESTAPVSISGQSFLINSNGLRANLNNQQFELNEHVKTQYIIDK